MNPITVKIEDGEPFSCQPGTRVGDLPHSATNDSGLPYIGAMVNNNLASLSFPLTVTSDVRFLTMADPHGWRLYRNSLSFLLAKTIGDCFPEAEFAIEHSFGPGLYCSFHKDASSPEGLSRRQLAILEDHMRELVRKDIPIERRKISFTDAVRQFEQAGQQDKLSILKYRNPPNLVIYWCDGFSDVAHGPLVSSTGVLTRFKLIPYKPGFILHLPEREHPNRMPPFNDQPHLFHIFREHKEWGRILNVNTVGRLNEIIAAGEIENFILTAEALHEKKLSQIADRIAAARDRIKLILIAGPSSAGKTTFAKRLTVHLTVNGLRPLTVATDDYFVEPTRTPRDADGALDYEHIEAVDLKLFNRHLLKLVQGKEIEPPRFNFQKHEMEDTGRKLRIEDDQMLIIEGIHGLNPRLTHRVPARNKFKIYVSALTQLNVDSNNRISTTDNRLMRRMVRDRKYRGHSALDTLRLWPSVRRGEKRWIFPFQREADVAFNSALDYELAVLKPLVEPLLMEVKPSDVEYAESRRLSEFLLSFLGTSGNPVPRMSILREYVGGSIFHY